MFAAVLLLLVVVLRQRCVSRASASMLHARFGVSWRTVKRWVRWFRDVFPSTVYWCRLRGFFGSWVRDDDLPSAAVEAVTVPASPGALLRADPDLFSALRRFAHPGHTC